jgi:hypothetical protein
MKAAWRLPAAQGQARLEKEAHALKKDRPSAAASLREGIAEMFTVNRMGLPALLSRCLRDQCDRVVVLRSTEQDAAGHALAKRRNGHTVGRGQSASHRENLRKLTGYKLLWMLQAYLDETSEEQLAEKRGIG